MAKFDNGKEPKPIEMQVDYKRVNTFLSDYCKNISRNYTFIKTHNPLAVGTQFIFKISVPNLPDTIILKGSVKRVITEQDTEEGKNPGMEISFEYDSEAEKARLFARIEKLIDENFGEAIGEKIRQYLSSR